MSTTAPSPTSRPAARAALMRPTLDDVQRLASVTTYPCVTVLLATAPQAGMSPSDRLRLDSLITEASRRLTEERSPQGEEILRALMMLADQVGSMPTDHAVALFATARHAEFLHLPVSVADRVVVDPTFATRDVLRAVHENPEYLLLLMSGESARLLSSEAGRLSEVRRQGFPVARESLGLSGSPRGERAARGRGARSGPAAISAHEREVTRAYLRHVDELVMSEVLRQPRPVVVMATERLLSDYFSVTRLSGRIIGLAKGSSRKPNLRVLEKLVRPVLDEHLSDLQAAAQDTLAARLPGREVVNGLAACWHAANNERPELLLVEQSFAMAVRVSEDGSMISPASDADHPDVIDDAVDELVELVMAQGGQVRFVPDGSLTEQERVSMSVLMTRSRHR